GGTSWMAWDRNAKSIRSWMLESGGGFGEGTWTKDGARWISKSSATLQDGKKVTATSVVTRVDDNTLTWEVKDRTHDGKPQPDIKPVKMKRGSDSPGNGRGPQRPGGRAMLRIVVLAGAAAPGARLAPPAPPRWG